MLPVQRARLSARAPKGYSAQPQRAWVLRANLRPLWRKRHRSRNAAQPAPEGFQVSRAYVGHALTQSASRLVAILAGGAAFAVLFWLFMLACSVGLGQ